MKLSAKDSACALVAAFALVHGASAQNPAASPKSKQSLEDILPVPVGETAKGVQLPDWEDGKLKMFFNMEELKRTDLEHIQMTNAKIQTYDDNQKIDLTLLLPFSVFNLKTGLLATDKQFVLQRTDFELMGDSLELDTVTRQAKISGKVKMIIYNFDVPLKKEPSP